ncbi:MAG: sigma-70 family RNA polymerase sigma factor, partial [Firmicutes bacterium]|nr:sigma-70 family RNA polymerase sigma factor [Bacillota bacterium]
MEFEQLLTECKAAVERFVRYRLPSQADAEDILQDVIVTAYQKLDMLKDRGSFKPWILTIARNRCNDYFREKARQLEIPLEVMRVSEETMGRHGVVSAVRETLEQLEDKEKQILYLYYFKELPQSEIAKRLDIPVGTVKSRLHYARKQFKNKYPYPPKGDCTMKKLPEYMPKYRIEKVDEEPFEVRWEELMGWFLVPRLGEKLSWGMYDMPSGKCDHYYDMEVTGRAEVHGIEGVELIAREASYSAKTEKLNRTFVAQLTDTHCRYLACQRTEKGVRRYLT